MVQSGDDYREKNRIRLQRFYEKQKKQGKKRVSALVSDEAYRLLTDEKEQAGESMSTLIDRAVMAAYGEHGVPNIVSDEAYALLMDAKEQTGESMPILIDRAVMAAFGFRVIPDIDDPALSEDFITNFEGPGQDGIPFEDIESDISLVDPEPETDDAEPAQDPETQGDQEKTDDELLRERDLKLVEIAEHYPSRNNAQKRVDVLNASGITLKGVAGEWTRKKFTDNLRFAKKRLGIK